MFPVSAYAFPAAIFILFKAIAKTEHAALARILTIFAGFLTFFYINTEIRHFFVGGDIRLSPMSNPEFYTYSLVWLIIASGLMFVGIWRDSQLLSQSALLLLLAAVGKVFVFDMSALDGLLRAISFLGLGACLIGIGFLYQRYGKNESTAE
ncbi:MAG: DUF2339 domain-containing protein [Sneathiella sp.]|nr:DUF2339 domain-containing protein [Sneathiella sp.]